MPLDLACSVIVAMVKFSILGPPITLGPGGQFQPPSLRNAIGNLVTFSRFLSARVILNFFTIRKSISNTFGKETVWRIMPRLFDR